MPLVSCYNLNFQHRKTSFNFKTMIIFSVLKATKAGGCVVLVGLGPSDIETPLVDATIKEIDIRGCIRYANCYPTALEMVASGIGPQIFVLNKTELK